MTDFTVQSLEIENFKGVRSLHLDFSDTVPHIYGDNATGKTTIYDALTWLLFGKDSSESAKFTVKPTVTAICKVNGQVHKLRKVLRERWSKPRGFEEVQYEGDTIDYTADDVPKKEAAYKKVITGFVNEEVFRLLTGVHQFAQLSETLGTRTTEEYKALVAEQKALEAENTAYRQSQWGKDERPALRAQLLQLETELDNIRVQTAVVYGQLQLDRLADCCEVMVDGVPYADLNHAMQVNVGVDIIRILSAHYGFRVPLVVDNTESVTQLQSIPAQVIRLVVSAPNHTLRVETC